MSRKKTLWGAGIWLGVQALTLGSQDTAMPCPDDGVRSGINFPPTFRRYLA